MEMKSRNKMRMNGAGTPRISVRLQLMIGGVLFFGILCATMAIGVVQTAQIIDQRRGPAPPGPEDWMLVRTVYRAPSDIRHIFSFTAAPMACSYSTWVGNVSKKVGLFKPYAYEPPQGYEYIPHVIAFSDVPPEAIEPADLNRLVRYEEDALIGLAFFAGDSLGGGPNSTSWCDSPLADLIPVNIVDREPVTGIRSDIRIKDWSFPPFKGFDFSTLRVHKLTKVSPKPGARVVATTKVDGESYPILVWWERNGVRIVVWAGCFDDLYNWKNAEFWRSYGARGGPLFARRLLYFAAQRREDEKPIPP